MVDADEVSPPHAHSGHVRPPGRGTVDGAVAATRLSLQHSIDRARHARAARSLGLAARPYCWHVDGLHGGDGASAGHRTRTRTQPVATGHTRGRPGLSHTVVDGEGHNIVDHGKGCGLE